MLQDEQFIAAEPDVASSPVGSGCVWELLVLAAAAGRDMDEDLMQVVQTKG